jgi:hypothetical protein
MEPMHTGKLPFGAWLTHQHHIEGDTATIKGIRLLARLVVGELSFPKIAKAYGTYYQWVVKHTYGTGTSELYTLALQAAWKMWELLPDEAQQKQATTRRE